MEIVSFKYIIFMSHLTLEQMHDLSMGLVLLPLKGLSLCLALSTFKHFFIQGVIFQEKYQLLCIK